MNSNNPLISQRLAKLKLHPQAFGHSDEYLTDGIEDATAEFLNQTRRKTDREEFNGPIVKMCLIALNSEGVEGTASASEGGISRSWDLDAMERIMAPYRLFLGESS